MILLDDLPCPHVNCIQQAEIVERFMVDDVEHVRIQCITGAHWFCIPVADLDPRLN